MQFGSSCAGKSSAWLGCTAPEIRLQCQCWFWGTEYAAGRDFPVPLPLPIPLLILDPIISILLARELPRSQIPSPVPQD